MKLRKVLVCILVLVYVTGLCACSRSADLVCAKCGLQYKSGASFCTACGEKLATANQCSCGYENEKGSKFCSGCGAQLTAQNNQSGSNGGQQTWLLLEEYIESTGVTIKYYYDRNGYLVGEASWRANGELNLETIYTNDSHGNCVEKYVPFWEQLGFDAYTTYQNTYDAKGRLVKSSSEDGGYDQYEYAGDALAKISYVEADGTVYYDQYENGRLIRSYRKDAATGYEAATIEFYYDKSGNFTGASHNGFEMDRNGNLINDGHAAYKYITLADYISQNLYNNSYANAQNNNGNSGGNNSGNSGGNNSGNGTPCQYCKQSGKMECSACDGTGKVFKEFDKNGNKVMKTCGNPSCSYGKIKCPYCRGDGIFGN